MTNAKKRETPEPQILQGQIYLPLEKFAINHSFPCLIDHRFP